MQLARPTAEEDGRNTLSNFTAVRVDVKNAEQITPPRHRSGWFDVKGDDVILGQFGSRCHHVVFLDFDFYLFFEKFVNIAIAFFEIL